MPEVERHGAHDGGRAAGPETRDAFVLGDAGEGVDDGGVVAALGDRFEAIGLHADEGEVGGVADDGCETACGEAGTGSFFEADFAASCFGGLGQGLHEGVEEAQAGGCVDGLSQKTGTEACIEIEHLARCYDVFQDGDGGGFGTGLDTFACELKAHFDHVDGLDHGGRSHAGDATVDKRKGSAHERCVEKTGGCLAGVFGGRLDS